ncbi:hypothetical protein D3C77_515010 [compost metagenome]
MHLVGHPLERGGVHEGRYQFVPVGDDCDHDGDQGDDTDNHQADRVGHHRRVDQPDHALPEQHGALGHTHDRDHGQDTGDKQTALDGVHHEHGDALPARPGEQSPGHGRAHPNHFANADDQG